MHARRHLIPIGLLGCGAVVHAEDLAGPLVFHAAFDGALAATARANGQPRHVEVQVVTQTGDATAVRCNIGSFPHELGTCALAVTQLSPGDYTVRADLLGASGAVQTRAECALHKPGPPSWTGNSLGQADKVLAPWEPLSGDAAQGEVHCWGRAYKFGTLLQEVRSNDVGLLSQPVQIEAVVAGTAHEFSGPPCQVQAASDTRSQWTK